MKKNIVILLTAILASFFIASAENNIQIPQLKPLSPHGSKVVMEHWKMGTINTSNIKTKYDYRVLHLN